MYKLSDRCSALRDEAVSKRKYMKKYCAQRNVYFSLGGALAAQNEQGIYSVVSSAVSNVLNKFTPVIIPGEIITGFNFGDGKFDDFYIPQNTPEDIEIMKENNISNDDIEKFFSIDKFYRDELFLYGYNLGDESTAGLTECEIQASEEWSALGRVISSNHTVLGYEQVVKLGFEGILNKIIEFKKKNGNNDLYSGAEQICLEALKMGEKYADLAQKLLDSQDENYDANDLKSIIEVCSNVPRYPARSFKEAVQSLWFAHVINTWEDIINANSIGRLDQILYPYYRHDIEKGIITKEEAFEIICCLWIKLYRDYDVQQSCVGGDNVDGECCVNDLSYMMLDATEALDFIRCMSVRFSKNTPKEFIKRALEVVGHVQKGVPFFFNDDVMIPALINAGIAPDDACNYTQIGCVETVIPGKSNPHAVTGETNFLKAIEYVLCRGKSMRHPDYSPGKDTGDLDNLDSFESFLNAVKVQIDNIMDLTCSQVKKLFERCISPKPYKSILTEGCLESGRDFNCKGALYDYYQIMIGGVPNLADSLCVINKFVYKQKKYSLSQLKSILESDFPDERIRMEFINKSEKFGNNSEEPDSLAREIIDYACDRLEELSKKYGMNFHAQPFTYLWMIDHGHHSAASPDGRKCGDPIAYSVSPMQGRDFNGLTAIMNSISSLPTKRTPGTTSAIVEVDPKLFCDKNIDALTDILVASGKKGLSNVQFNTVDAEMLIDAQKYPEKYNNLAVRVSGFSQRFNLLNKELQNHIIGRTKHSCL